MDIVQEARLMSKEKRTQRSGDVQMASCAPDHLSQNSKWRCSINLHQRVTIRPRHSIPIISSVLSIIGPIRRIPCLIVHRAIQPLWNAILGKHIRVEENLSAISLKTYQTTLKHIRRPCNYHPRLDSRYRTSFAHYTHRRMFGGHSLGSG